MADNPAPVMVSGVVSPEAEQVVLDLRAQLTGSLIRIGDEGYDEARRLWNGAVDKRPAMIVRCRTAQDVAAAITFAQDHHLPASVRSGGHNTVGLALNDGGLVIDLSQMKGIAVDPLRRLAQAQPGLTLGELVQAVEPYGLLTTTGTCSGNGLGGATLGGGIGWLVGKHGLIVDNVRSFELVTADGRLLVAGANENPDLFWALRGGGGNFGVITSIEYQLHPIGKVLGGMVIHSRAKAGEIMRFYRDFSSAAPDDLTVYATLMTLPDVGPAIALTACYCGDDLAAGERLMGPLHQFGPPLVDTIGIVNYSEVLALFDPAAPDGRHYYDTAFSLRNPSDAALDAIVANADAATSPFSAIVIHHVHGAATRVPAHETAYALRVPHCAIIHAAGWEQGPAQPHVQWAEDSLARMQPFIDLGLCVNFMGQGTNAEIRESYQANYQRLVALKNKYDPTNFFRFNQNVAPDVDTGQG